MNVGTELERRAATKAPETLGRLGEFAGAAALLVVAWIHIVDLPGKMSEVPYLGVAYVVLIAGSLLAAALLLRKDRRGWFIGGLLAAGAAVAFVLSRTTGLPAATDDVGNWSETLGTCALIAEGFVALLATASLAVTGRSPVGSPSIRVVVTSWRTPSKRPSDQSRGAPACAPEP